MSFFTNTDRSRNLIPIEDIEFFFQPAIQKGSKVFGKDIFISFMERHATCMMAISINKFFLIHNDFLNVNHFYIASSAARIISLLKQKQYKHDVFNTTIMSLYRGIQKKLSNPDPFPFSADPQTCHKQEFFFLLLLGLMILPDQIKTETLLKELRERCIKTFCGPPYHIRQDITGRIFSYVGKECKNRQDSKKRSSPSSFIS